MIVCSVMSRLMIEMFVSEEFRLGSCLKAEWKLIL